MIGPSEKEKLTADEIQRIRVTFQAFSADADQAKRLMALCDMALASLSATAASDRSKTIEECAKVAYQCDPLGITADMIRRLDGSSAIKGQE